jgi:hypothetical protein
MQKRTPSHHIASKRSLERSLPCSSKLKGRANRGLFVLAPPILLTLASHRWRFRVLQKPSRPFGTRADLIAKLASILLIVTALL